MCPDRQIISVYIDNELLSPWKEKMEAHLESCPKCRTELNKYKLLRETLGSIDHGTAETAQKRVWEKLNTPELISGGNVKIAEWRFGRKRLWNRTVTLPLPAAAAALLIFAFSFAIILMNNGSGTTEPVTVVAEQLNPIVQEWSGTLLGDDHDMILPTLDMDDFLQFLINQNEGDFVLVRLPETSRFSRTGQATLISASDYSRSRIHR